MRLDSVRRRRLIATAAILVLALALAACSDPMSTVDPKSDHAETVNDVYIVVFWLAMIVFVGVLGATLVLSIWFRERPGRVAKQIHGNSRLEVVWTLIPVVILVAIFVPTVAAISDLEPDDVEDLPANAVHVEAIGHQWWFEFRYPDLGIVTANELHVPVDRPVLVTLTSNDVIHSFGIPQLAGKVDMVPGRTNAIQFTPNEARDEAYLGQCVEFCGTSHANMRFRVFVDEQATFDAWVANETAQAVAVESLSELAQAGSALFTNPLLAVGATPCIGCHTVKGTLASGTIGPNLTHVGGRSTLFAGVRDGFRGADSPDRVQRDLERWITNPDDIKPGVTTRQNGMPAWGELLSAEQITAIAAYLRELQ
ncbi:MAG: cytochrome c oxidase subunit II [Chloroflexi bacterium]|nr:cytochrome c oxidase subunit II [Chloroflexota bacterium]